MKHSHQPNIRKAQENILGNRIRLEEEEEEKEKEKEINIIM